MGPFPVGRTVKVAFLEGKDAATAVHIETLKRAAELVGGQEALARRLEVAPRHLALWIKGMVSPPGEVFLRAADIVSEHEVQEITKPGSVFKAPAR